VLGSIGKLPETESNLQKQENLKHIKISRLGIALQFLQERKKRYRVFQEFHFLGDVPNWKATMLTKPVYNMVNKIYK